MRLFFSGILALLLAAPLCAQTGGTIAGTIYCADTGRPARFAAVALYPADASLPASTGNVLQAATSSPTRTPTALPTHADADGAFLFTDVPPGLYFIFVMFDGYLNPTDAFARDQLQSTDPETRKLVLASVPNISVGDNGSARLDLRIERAAAISGRILYDDGSPAGHWKITARPADPKSKAKVVGDGTTFTYTDDRGNFRLPSVPAGSYIVQANFDAVFLRGNSTNIQSRRFALSIYSGSALRLADATSISVTSGEEHSGIDLTVPLHGLHTISGSVAAQSDGHPVNSGFITLTSPDDPHFDFQTYIGNSGNFVFYYIPGNTTYTLRVNAQDVTLHPAKDLPLKTINGKLTVVDPNLHRYAELRQDVRLDDADLAGVSVLVPEVDQPRKDAAP